MSVDFKPRHDPIPEGNDRDITVAHAAAEEAERLASQAVVKTIQDMCDNDRQRTIAASIVTAAILEKFEGSTRLDPGFAQAVTKLREHMRPTVQGMVDDRFVPFTWKDKALRLLDNHPVLSVLAFFGGLELVLDLLTIALQLAS